MQAAAPAAPTVSLPDFSSLVTQYGPAVVNITVKQTVKTGNRLHPMPFPGFDEDSPFAPFFRGFPAPGPSQRILQGQGSGFIVGSDGLVLTNAHVVDDATDVTVKLTDKREFTAKVLGVDKQTDVAVLRINAKNLPTVRLGNPDDLKVGQWVVAIGSPFGFENSVTAGIVSAKGRALPDETYVPFIQTDVAVNPGNSGGPLFNLRGEVVGINSQIFSRSGGYQGVSFAIPIDVALRVEKELVASGRVSRGWLGIGIQGMNQQLAKSLGLDQARGALVAQVQPDSPAARAGIRTGDVITEFNGHPIRDSADLPPLVGAAPVGNNATVKLIRDGKEKVLNAVVAQLADGKNRPGEPAPGDEHGGLGLAVADISKEQREELGLASGGVVVTQVAEGPAAEAGIRPGDVLLQIGQKEIQNARQFRQIVAAAPSGQPVPVLVRRGQNTLFFALEPGARDG
jgi:serine protease Do